MSARPIEIRSAYFTSAVAYYKRTACVPE